METIGLNDIIGAYESSVESDSEEVRAWESIVILEPDHDIAEQL